jgi:microcin C transport system substrate-binding protein
MTQNHRMRIWWCCLAWLVAFPAWGAHAYAQFGDIRYGPGFSHFDYVNPDAPKGGEIRLVPSIAVTLFDKFNPFTLKGTPPAGLTELMFETLMTGNLQEPATAYGLLAEDIDVAPDGRSATFRLRPQARFNNGLPVLAADVVHSFETLKSPRVAPQYRTLLADVTRAVAVGERVVRFEFSRDSRELPLLVGSIPVFSRQWGAGKPFDEVTTDLPIASGPYQPSSARLGRDITYVRRPGYWGWDLPVRRGHYNFDRITYKLYLDDAARFEGLKAGEFDLKREFISRNWARQYRGRAFDSGEVRKRVFEHRYPGDFQGYIFNQRNPKLQDVRVRQALALTMDFEWLNRQMFYGLYARVQGWFPNSDFQAVGEPKPDELALLEPLRASLRTEVFGPVPLSATTAPPGSLRENLRRARTLLAEAGWTYRNGALRNAGGEAFTLEYLTSQPSGIRLVLPMQGAMAKLGIALTFRTVDGALYQQRMDDFNFEMASLRIPASLTPGSELFERFGSKAAKTPGSANYWGIADPAIDALIRHAVAATTRDQLNSAMRSLDRVLRFGYHAIPQWTSSNYFVGYRPAGFALPPVVPPYYEPDSWAAATWWATPANR